LEDKKKIDIKDDNKSKVINAQNEQQGLRSYKPSNRPPQKMLYPYHQQMPYQYFQVSPKNNPYPHQQPPHQQSTNQQPTHQQFPHQPSTHQQSPYQVQPNRPKPMNQEKPIPNKKPQYGIYNANYNVGNPQY
jgi:hypothetical protein